MNAEPELRERVARAIADECRGDGGWPDGGGWVEAGERDHWYACADRVFAVLGEFDALAQVAVAGEQLAAIRTAARSSGVYLTGVVEIPEQTARVMIEDLADHRQEREAPDG